MLRKLLFVTVCAAGLSLAAPFTGAYAETAPLTADQQAALNAATSSVESLIIQYQNDPDGLQAAIQSLVENASDPEMAGNAVTSVFNNPTNATVKNILAAKPGLLDAGGNGLGAAIATIGVTNPTLATQMLASAKANGGTKFASSVQSGNDTQTGSIQQQSNTSNNNNDNNTDNNNNSTPETPASAT